MWPQNFRQVCFAGHRSEVTAHRSQLTAHSSQVIVLPTRKYPKHLEKLTSGLIRPKLTFLDLRLAFKSVWDTFCIGKTRTCDLWPVSCRKPSNFVILLSEEQSYTTRNVSLQQLNISFYKRNIRDFFSTIIGRYFWNDLPLSTRFRQSNKLFKCFLFSHYLSQY